MSKSIFVIDTPSICADCPRFPICSLEYALLHGKELKVVGKPIKEICKLKPMPEKKDRQGKYYKYAETTMGINHLMGYDKGYNACIDEILGEEE